VPSKSTTGFSIDDSLQRLIKAETSGPEWGQAFVYDGWGNLVSKNATKGSVPTFQLTANPANNWLSARTYDANGNDTTGGLTYDVANRLNGAGSGASATTYSYSADNRRVLKRTSGGTETYTFWSITGQRLGDYTLSGTTWTTASINLYFHGRLIQSNGQVVITDRLGSNVAGGRRYYPYGEERSATADNAEKFGTYFRDAESGLDYADQRFYGSTLSRFATPDPLAGSAILSNSQSWNRYTQSLSDPINTNDPSGLTPIPVTSSLLHCSAVNSGYSEPTSINSPVPTAYDCRPLIRYFNLPIPQVDIQEALLDQSFLLDFLSQQLAQGVSMALNTLANNKTCRDFFASSEFIQRNFNGDPAAMLLAYVSNNLIKVSTWFNSNGTATNFASAGVGAVTTPTGALTFNGVRTNVKEITVNMFGFCTSRTAGFQGEMPKLCLSS
jgi:RHS repeat-associated protein